MNMDNGNAALSENPGEANRPDSEQKAKSSPVTIFVSAIQGGWEFEWGQWRLGVGGALQEPGGGTDNDNGGKEHRETCQAVYKMRDRFHNSFESVFERLGERIGKRPILTIVIAVMLVAICSVGFVRLKEENRIEVLWVPDNTQAKHDRQVVQDVYPTSPDIHQVIITTNPQGGNILEPSALGWAQDVHKRIKGLEVSTFLEGHGCSFTYEDICAKQGSMCWHLSVLQAVGFDNSTIRDVPDILRRLNNIANQFADKFPVRIEDMLGGVEKNSTGYITGARAATFTYFVQRDDQSTDSAPNHNCTPAHMAESWQLLFLERMQDIQQESLEYGFKVDYISQGSWDLELQNSISSEAWLLNFAVVLVLGYTVAMMSRWGEGFVGTRIILSILGIACIGMSIVASIGLCSFFGLAFSPLMGLMPFLLLGVGADNMFVIVNAFDKASLDLEVHERLGSALGLSGTSITVTSVTNLFAFAIGSQTSLPVLRAFSIYATVGILCNYLLQITLFPALLVMDSRRQKAKRYDIFLCFKRRKEPATQTGPQNCFVDFFATDQWLARIMKLLGRALTRKWVKALVLVAFAGLAGVGVWGTCMIRVESDLNNFVPADSHIVSFDATRDTYFPETGDQTAVYLQDIDFSNPSAWTKMLNMTASFRQNEYVETRSVKSWFETFLNTANATGEVNASNFNAKVREWMEKDSLLTGSAVFSADIVWSKDRNEIKSCRFQGNHIKLHSSKEKVAAMDSLRSVWAPPSGISKESIDAFVYSDHYLVYEQFKIMGKEALLNILLALVMVFTVVVLLFMNIKASVMTWFNIVLAIVELIGLLSLWGFHLDTTMVIFVVVSMGLVVDYSAHIVHGFLKMEGGPDERLVEVLGRIGPAVFNAAASTFVAVMLLVLSKLFVFKLFFRTFLLCVLLGLLHGIVLLPVCLSLVNPGPKSKSKGVSGNPSMNGSPASVPSSVETNEPGAQDVNRDRCISPAV